MPQCVPTTEAGALRPGVLYVPVEMLTEPDGYACPMLDRVRGTGLAAAEAAARGRYFGALRPRRRKQPPGERALVLDQSEENTPETGLRLLLE